jgi:energy-coupling factor transporter ATP-binding protein EcfA2
MAQAIQAAANAGGPTSHTHLQFTQATKEKAKARVALCGPSGSGKTFTGLTIATALGSRIGVIDTERGSASKYADEFAFDRLELDQYDPRVLVDALGVAAGAGFDVVMVDSLTHFWSGSGGMLEQVDAIARRSSSNNTFAAWKDARPLERRMIDALVSYPGHVIVTMRSKTKYEIDQSSGRSAPRKVGLAPEQRDGIEYEFDIVGDMDPDNTLTVTKSRARALSGAVVAQPTMEFGLRIKEWLEAGVEPAVRLEDLTTRALDPTATFEGLRDLMAIVRRQRVSAAPLLDEHGKPSTLGEVILRRGQELKQAAPGGDTGRNAA